MFAQPFIPPSLPMPQPMVEPPMGSPPIMPAPQIMPPNPAPVLPPVAPMPVPPTVSKSEKDREKKIEGATRLMKSAQESYKTPDMGPGGAVPNPAQTAGNMPQAMSLKGGWGGGH